MYEKREYLENYLTNYYNLEYIDKRIEEYLNIILKKIDKIKENLSEIEIRSDGDFYFSIYEVVEKLLNATTYDEIKKSLDIK